jgi:hypothetical protein
VASPFQDTVIAGLQAQFQILSQYKINVRLQILISVVYQAVFLYLERIRLHIRINSIKEQIIMSLKRYR